MDADATERERALEERIARLETRLIQLEHRVDIEAASMSQMPATATRATATPRPAPHVSAVNTAPLPHRAPQDTPRTAEPAVSHHSAGTVNVPPWEARPAAQAIQQAVRPSAWAHAPDPRIQTGSQWTNAPAPSPRISQRLGLDVHVPDFSGSFNEIEARLAGRALAWVGGIALVLGAIFFLSLAFSRGWIGPELRVLMGLVAGSIGLAGGAVLLERGNRLLGHVMVPVGIAVISIGLIAATSLYALIPVELGLAGALICAVAAAFIAVRSDSQIVALFGLVAVLLAPPLMGASPTMVTLLFVAAVLVGTTAVAVWRSWSWLPPVAFALSAPQAATWIVSRPDTPVALIGIGLFWLLNVVAAGGEAFRRRRDDLTTSSTGLLLANAAFVMWAGFNVLSGDLTIYRGFFLILVALAHLAVGGYFIVRDGERNLFGLLAVGTGIAALTMAAPVQLGAPAVPIAWTAEAVALAWLAAKRGHPYSALVAGVEYALAGLYLIVLFIELVLPPGAVPLADASGASLAFFVAGVGAGVYLLRDRSLRSALAAFGLLVALSCVSAVLAPPPAVAVLAVLTVVAAGVWRALPILPNEPIAWQFEGLIPRSIRRLDAEFEWRRVAEAALPVITACVGVAATAQLMGPVWAEANVVHVATTATAVPFVNTTGLALALYLLGLIGVAVVTGVSRLREPLAAIGLLVVAWMSVAELEGLVLVAAWATLMVGGLVVWRALGRISHDPPLVLRRGHPFDWTLDLVLPGAAITAGLAAAVAVVGDMLPLAEFGNVKPPEVPFTDQGAVAAMILVVATLAGGAVIGGALARRLSILIAGGVVAYAIPFEVYGWAVSVLWVGVGALALVIATVDTPGRRAYLIADASLVVAAEAVALWIAAPPSMLVVGQVAMDPIVLGQAVAALGAVAAGLLLLAREGAGVGWVRVAGIAAGVTTVYLVSVAVVGLVATQIGGTTTTEELQTQGQVALSIVWTVLGITGFVAGLRLRIDDLRHGGLALLALATAKVFLFDLAALDVAYRVISLIVLGVVLLASAWLWQRAQPRPPVATPQEHHAA